MASFSLCGVQLFDSSPPLLQTCCTEPNNLKWAGEASKRDRQYNAQSVCKIKTPTFYFSVREFGEGEDGVRWEGIFI